MSGALASCVAWALCFAGMAALSLAIDRHHAQVIGRFEPSRVQRWCLRGLGGLWLVGALWHCITVWGGSVGTVAWFGFLTAGALAVVSMLPYRPRTGTVAAAMLGVAALACLLRSGA